MNGKSEELNLSAQEILLQLVPEGMPLGRKTLEASVFTEYSSDPGTRLVQELCGLVGGETVYLELRVKGKPTRLLPVCETRSADSNGGVRNAVMTCITFLSRTLGKDNSEVVAFGGDRKRWTVCVTCRDRQREALDDQTDKVSGPGLAMVGDTEKNGIRKEF